MANNYIVAVAGVFSTFILLREFNLTYCAQCVRLGEASLLTVWCMGVGFLGNCSSFLNRIQLISKIHQL